MGGTGAHASYVPRKPWATTTMLDLPFIPPTTDAAVPDTAMIALNHGSFPDVHLTLPQDWVLQSVDPTVSS